MSLILELIIYLAVGTVYWWWGQNLAFYGLVPNFIFAAGLSASILAGPVKGLAWAFFLGVYADLLGGGAFGGYALTYTLLAYAVYIFKRHFDMDSLFSQVVAALVLSWGCMLFYWLLGMLFSEAALRPELRVLLVEPFLNALAVPVVFNIFYRLKRNFGVL